MQKLYRTKLVSVSYQPIPIETQKQKKSRKDEDDKLRSNLEEAFEDKRRFLEVVGGTEADKDCRSKIEGIVGQPSCAEFVRPFITIVVLLATFHSDRDSKGAMRMRYSRFKKHL